jgi:NADH-ubiquinone oxidoreductase chain 5
VGAHEAPIRMLIPLFLLGLGAIFYGFMTRDLIIGLGTFYFNSVHINFHNFNLIDSEFLSGLIKNIPFVFTVLGSTCSLLLINCFNTNKTFVYDLKLNVRQAYIFLNKK